LDGDLKTDRWLESFTNTFLGHGVAGAGNLTHTEGADGWYNTAIGNVALYANTTGYNNIALGSYALSYNTTGIGNTAIGSYALYANETGGENTAIGISALSSELVSRNTAVGAYAGHFSSGDGNVFLGYSAGGLSGLASNRLYIANSDTSNPLIYGEFDNKKLKINGTLGVAGTAQFDLPTSPATMIQVSTPGNKPGFVGFATNGNRRDIAFRDEGLALAVSDSSSLPNWDRGLMIAQTGNVGIGFNNTTGYKLYVNGSAAKTDNEHWTVVSDARLKDVTAPYEHGLDEVVRLQPVRFHYKEGNALDLPTDKENVGLVAQDVKGVIPEAVSEDSSGYLALNGTPIHYAMLNAIKELQAEIEALKKRIKELENGKDL